MARHIFITGGSGYVGRDLIPALLARGHRITAVARPGSEAKFDPSWNVITADVMNGESYLGHVTGCDTFIHLVGVPHPSPAKAKEFVAIDLRAAQEAIRVATLAHVRHFVYVSVAHPAPVMAAYIAVRAECEAILKGSGLPATILRPWYVLGPGHRWPWILKPVYRIAEWIPATRDGARRLGLVTIGQMKRALTWVVEAGPNGVRVLNVPDIRAIGNAGEQGHATRI